jgi:hypothetical protein
VLRKRRILLAGTVTFAIGTVLTTACESPAPVDPIGDAAAQHVLTSGSRPSQNPDAEWAMVARGEVPGFAGYYSDGDYDVVLVTEMKHGAAAVAYVKKLGPPPARLRRDVRRLRSTLIDEKPSSGRRTRHLTLFSKRNR